ncbi:MAG TPA: TlpA disulfide reductase family protein [Planctomycetaceae bacterium]
MIRSLAVIGMLSLLTHPATAADRDSAVDRLESEYQKVEKEFFETPEQKEPTNADSIRRYEAWPGWKYIPRFLELAEAMPDDEAAFRCCQWIFDRTRNVGNQDKLIFSADQKAWDIVAAHHTHRADLPTLCVRAVEYDGPAQERFLRGLVKRQDVSRERTGFAIVALGELLAHKHNLIEYFEHRPSSKSEFEEFVGHRKSPDWGKDLSPANAAKFKPEAIQLFRETHAHFADVPVTLSAPGFRRLNNLGDKAGKSLHALEHLTIGSESPAIVGKDLDGQPLNLRDHRGKVVIVSFWFTGCGPCMGLIPQEQRLVKTHKDRPFALLGVCTDETLDQARKTAHDHGIDWACWFDGENGPIAREWNVLSWPTIYVLDPSGRIVAKNLPVIGDRHVRFSCK